MPSPSAHQASLQMSCSESNHFRCQTIFRILCKFNDHRRNLIETLDEAKAELIEVTIERKHTHTGHPHTHTHPHAHPPSHTLTNSQAHTPMLWPAHKCIHTRTHLHIIEYIKHFTVNLKHFLQIVGNFEVQNYFSACNYSNV